MFSEELKKYDWDETTQRIASKTDNDVRRALAKSHCDVEDFMALLSPAAEPYLETMARLSRRYTEERFGRTMSMFIPLYITNSCANSCVYCGFHRENPMARTILTPEQSGFSRLAFHKQKRGQKRDDDAYKNENYRFIHFFLPLALKIKTAPIAIITGINKAKPMKTYNS